MGRAWGRAALACLRSEETSTVAGPQWREGKAQERKSFIRDGPVPDHERFLGSSWQMAGH